MIYRGLADLVLILHLCYVLFVVIGGLLIVQRGWVLWAHLPAVFWAVLVEFFQLSCPLTTLENYLKQLGGEQGYKGGFIEYYTSLLLYTPITPQTQIMLGLSVILINSAIYWYVFQRSRHLM